jgi:uracil phosphoribosyltransferase
VDTLTLVDHPLAGHLLAELRDVTTPPERFRHASRRLSTVLALEATRRLAVRRGTVATPLREAEVEFIADPVVAVPILRAGLGLLDPVLDLLPEVQVGYAGLERDETTLRPTSYYLKVPDLTGSVVLLLDPMLATGGSAAATIDILKAWGAARIKQVSLIAAPEGVATLTGAHHDVDIHVAALDSHLNERGYIVPGLGDAGDRQFGTFAGPGSEPGHGPDPETVEVVRRLQKGTRG